MSLWEKLFSRQPDYGGAPHLGRQKTYSADSGYVYQYKLGSFRNQRHGGEHLYEYAFEVRGAPGEVAQILISLREPVLRDWSARHDRDLTASDRYGIAKIALKRSLDVSGSPKSLPSSVTPDLNELSEIAEFLGF